MSKVLITGGLGFVGGRLAKKLSGDHQVIVTSRSIPTQTVLQQHGDVSCIEHKLLLSKETFPQHIDTVIHLAALNEWDCVKFPSEAIRVNIDETRIVLENSIAAGAKRFIYFSTAHVYGSPLQGEITENSLPVPAHPYAITHKAAEDYVVAAALQKKIQATVIRLSNSFGAPVLATVNRWTLLVNDLARQAIETGKLALNSNGCQFRDFVCLQDVENVLHTMVTGNNGPAQIIYNLGAGASMRVLDMANRVATIYTQLTGKPIHVTLPAGVLPTQESALHFNIGRLLNEGFCIENAIDDELKRLIIFCRDHFCRHP
jgi:UDP-glucose 4-epimerase